MAGTKALLAAALLLAVWDARADHVHEPVHEHGHEHPHGHAHERAAAPDDRPSRLEAARELQRNHQFEDAAAELAAHLESNPFDLDAQLLHADVLQHAGRLAEARKACVRVAVAGSSTLAGYCAVQVLLAAGDYQRANAASEAFADARGQLPDTARQWALEISAEAAWRAGHPEAAESLFEQALDFDHPPHSTVAAMTAFREATGH